jgi:hypothetical protein
MRRVWQCWTTFIALGSLMRLVARSSYAKTDTVTVTRTSDGLTEQSMGATEGCTRFNLDELVDAGLGHYRLWTGMSRLEGDMRCIPSCCRSYACSS